MTTTLAPAKPKPAERRLAAINALTSVVYGRQEAAHPFLLTLDDRATAAAAIRALTPLGRTYRWTANVEEWAKEVEAATTDSGLRWAWQQYAVWTCYAAE